jgi:hypothetical protein
MIRRALFVLTYPARAFVNAILTLVDMGLE